MTFGTVRGDAAGTRVVALVGSYVGLDIAVEAADLSAPSLVVGGKSELCGANTAAHYLCTAAGRPELLGEGDDAQAEVSQWLSRCHSDFAAPVDDKKLAALNDALAARTWLVGHAVTAADLAVFGAVHAALAALPPARHASLVHAMRWADLIGHACDVKGLYAPLSFGKPRFMPPEVAEAPAPPAKEGKDGGKGKENEGKKADGGNSKKEKGGEATKAPAEGKGKGGGDATKAAGKEAGGAALVEGKGKEGKGEMKEKKEKPAKEMPQKKEVSLSPGMMDVRVGTIVDVWEHPDADGLWCEKIDFGEKEPRQVVSGLRKFVPKERMLGARVVALCNAKPGNLRGQRSEGVVMCGSNADHTDVDFVVPPEGVPNGERVTFEGHPGPPEEVLNPKKKIYEGLQPLLKTDASGTANYDGVPFMTTKGPCVSRIAGGSVA